MLERTRQSFQWWKPSCPALEDWVRKNKHFLDSHPQALKISYASLPVVPYICINKVLRNKECSEDPLYSCPIFGYPSALYAEKKKNEQVVLDINIWKKKSIMHVVPTVSLVLPCCTCPPHSQFSVHLNKQTWGSLVSP